VFLRSDATEGTAPALPDRPDNVVAQCDISQNFHDPARPDAT
jgi:hypothetical protein